MLVEILVITSCIQGPGCSESTAAYYHYNPHAQIVVERVEKCGKRIVNENEWIVYVATPAYALAFGQTAHFKLKRSLMLDVNPRNQMVGLRWSY